MLSLWKLRHASTAVYTGEFRHRRVRHVPKLVHEVVDVARPRRLRRRRAKPLPNRTSRLAHKLVALAAEASELETYGGVLRPILLAALFDFLTDFHRNQRDQHHDDCEKNPAAYRCPDDGEYDGRWGPFNPSVARRFGAQPGAEGIDARADVVCCRLRSFVAREGTSALLARVSIGVVPRCGAHEVVELAEAVARCVRCRVDLLVPDATVNRTIGYVRRTNVSVQVQVGEDDNKCIELK